MKVFIFLLSFFIVLNFIFAEKIFYDEFFFVEKEYNLNDQQQQKNYLLTKKEENFLNDYWDKGFAFLFVLAYLVIIYDGYLVFWRAFQNKKPPLSSITKSKNEPFDNVNNLVNEEKEAELQVTLHKTLAEMRQSVAIPETVEEK